MPNQPANGSPRFEIGLVMAGACSAGAYIAGVIDFLIEALDAWEQEKSKPGYQGPCHDVTIKVMAGSSAGAMTSAITAVALQSEIDPVHDVDNPPAPERNRLFDSWVRRVDATCLLQDEDLRVNGRVVSMLDSTELDRIANDAMKTPLRQEPRRYVSDPLAIFLTVANLRGVPYSFQLAGAADALPFGMLAHADHVRFSVSRTGKAISGARLLDPASKPGDNWPLLALAALASGAFPIGLQSRILEREFDELDHWHGVKPSWPAPVPTGSYKFLCVDGGLMNNEPLEFARRHLAEGGQNPRDGEAARRAVIMIDPFPNQVRFKADYAPDARLFPVIAGMFNSLIEQARFKPEELSLAEDPNVYSRFVIAPARVGSQGSNVEPAIASAILAGFGGFLSEQFRKHDFQLGRRNCQKFLYRHFCLPETNPLFRTWSDPSARESYYIRTMSGQVVPFMPSDPTKLLPIVPLMPHVQEEIKQYEPPRADSVDIDRLERLAEERIKKVGALFIDNDMRALLSGSIVRWAAKRTFNMKLAPKLRDKLRNKVAEELAGLK